MNTSKLTKITISAALCCLIFGIVLGFSVTDKKPGDKQPDDLIQGRVKNENIQKKKFSETGRSNRISSEDNTVNQIYGSPYYSDNFDGSNDTNSLKARGYLVYYRGTGFQNTNVSTWFQGNPLVFGSFNGPTSGYVASYYQTATGANNIDNWLVLPKKNTNSNDSLIFYQRTQNDPQYPDSIRVMYSAAGDSVPEAGSWTELGRFRVHYSTNAWQRTGFRAGASGTGARFAIRYSIVNSGPSGVNGNYIGIDALTIESNPASNDAGVQNINSPSGTITLPSAAIIPSALIKNFGTSVQSFNVTMTINPGGYSGTQTVTGLGGGLTQNVNFAGYTPAAGNYTVKVFTQLSGDENIFNDTVTGTFSVVQPNYGGGGTGSGGYYFANSSAGSSGAVSKPGYCRTDTSGSISLVLNNQVKVPLSNGNTDDGYWMITGIGLPRKIKFMGVKYDSVYIGTNGIICFKPFVPDSGNWNPPANGLPGNGSTGNVRPGVYPFWNDLDWGNTDQPVNRLSYKVDNSRNQLVINYDKAPLFSGAANEFETFQVCIELQADTAGAPDSRILFNYDNSSTTANIPFLSGIMDATGTKYLQYSFMNSNSYFITPGPLYDSGYIGMSVAFGTDAGNLQGNCRALNLTALIQGFWDGADYTADTLAVNIRNAVSPYNIIETVRAKTDTSGYIVINYSNVSQGVPYYIVINHRNSLETWSKISGVTWTGNSPLTYNFTSAASQAYNSNMVLKSGKYCIWGSDVNQDGIVDAGDLSIIENNLGQAGYINSDVTGDQTVDASDISLVENNLDITPIIERP
ncbi:MAG: choice-of-anchor J domain-containing protein [Ignavibacteria bacterium]|nr:choice-of-anchor J domain-containing protein [Ignavibacteria bacterium]